MQTKVFRLGTRGSPLALKQAHEVRDRLLAAWGDKAPVIEIEVISTAGDRIVDRALAEIGGKGLFTEEIEARLLNGGIDLAVHSSKDMPTTLPDGLVLEHFLPREDVRDAFISMTYPTLASLPPGAVVGTASLRRQALVKRLRPDVDVVTYRGNVQSRLRKLEEGIVDATLLAMAGLNRLDMAHVATDVMAVTDFLPAVGQGAIGIETRAGDLVTQGLLAPIHDDATAIALRAERSFLAALDGSCRTPIAGHAVVSGMNLTLTGLILTPDGAIVHQDVASGSVTDAVSIGRELGLVLKARGGADFFRAG